MADLQAPQGIEAEADDYDGTDSALGDDTASSTASLSSTIYKHRYENGRTYHAFKGDEGIYNFPNDDTENDRLDMQHHLFNLTFNGKLFLNPIPESKKLGRVLDLGTGTGIWAIDFADTHQESEVVGVDLSPIQPPFLPPNLSMEIDDIEDTWTYSHKFDFIYARMMTASIKNWPGLLKQIYDNLNPGGYVELSDICFPIMCDDDSLPANAAILRWTSLIMQSGEVTGRICNSAVHYKSQLEALGFVNVVEVIHKWPQNRWPKDKYYKELGMWNHENFSAGLEALSLGLLTRYLGWSPEEVNVFLVDVRKEMKDTKIHAYYPIYTVYGMKPEPEKVLLPEV